MTYPTKAKVLALVKLSVLLVLVIAVVISVLYDLDDSVTAIEHKKLADFTVHDVLVIMSIPFAVWFLKGSGVHKHDIKPEIYVSVQPNPAPPAASDKADGKQ